MQLVRVSYPLLNGLCPRCLKKWQNRRSFHSLTLALQSQSALPKLVEVGRFENPKSQEHYQPGQFFLHSVFGYRGVVLFQWLATVYDRDTLEDSNPVTYKENMKGETKPYYQALVDSRDFPYIRTSPDAIAFVADRKDASLYSIPGLDYVSHEETLPYTATDQDPFRHELFGQFLSVARKNKNKGVAYIPREMLMVWREKNHRWLELTDVHRQTTQGVRVTVMPFYMGQREIQQVLTYWWRYSIRVENFGTERVQLRERHWNIYGLSGTLETTKGRGVIGQEPILSSTHPAFQYSSHVCLQSPSGHMWGTYTMERQDGKTFSVVIPPFTLESHEES